MIENIPPCSRKKGCFCTFNDFKTFVQLSFPSLPQISTSFPNHAFRNAHFSRVRAFKQGKPPLYFVACYYAQYRMRSAILRNHLKEPYRNYHISLGRSNRGNETEFSNHVWTLQDTKKPFQIKWKVLKKCKPYSNTNKKCKLCGLCEKFIFFL